jgi:hypothetical protein
MLKQDERRDKEKGGRGKAKAEVEGGTWKVEESGRWKEESRIRRVKVCTSIGITKIRHVNQIKSVVEVRLTFHASQK